MSETRLSYTCYPETVEVSQPGVPSLAAVVINVTNPTQNADGCTSIVFSFRVGPNAGDFCSDATSIQANAPLGWSFSARSGGDFTATPDTPADGNIDTAGLTFLFSNILVNEQAGPTELKITEVMVSGHQGERDFWLTKEAGDALLTYAIDPPANLQATASDQDPALAQLSIVVNTTGQIVNCKSISFSFPVGENAKDLTNNAGSIGTSLSTEGWSFIQTSVGVFTATPLTTAAGNVGIDSLTFTLSNIRVNQRTGSFYLTIIEDASQPTAEPPIPDGTRKKTILLTKSSPQFELSDINFPDSSIDQDPSIDQADTITLGWSGPFEARYRLEYDDAAKVHQSIEKIDGQWLPSEGSYAVKGTLEDTTFYLTATMLVLGEPQHLMQSFPVTVNSVLLQSFTASQLTVYGANNQVPVRFDWDVIQARVALVNGQKVPQVFLNGDLVDPVSNRTELVNQTTKYSLVAQGKDGLTQDITVTVLDVNLTVALQGNDFIATFGANAGTYGVGFWLGNIEYVQFLETEITVDAPGQVVSVHAPRPPVLDNPGLEHPIYVMVTVEGFPSGELSASIEIN